MRVHNLPSARTLILWLVIGCIIPSMIGVCYLFVLRIREGREQLEKSTIRSAANLSLSLDERLSKVEALALILSQGLDLKANNLALFHRYAKDILAKTERAAIVVLSDASGKVVLNTQVDFGTALPMYGNQVQLRQVFETGEAVISNVFTGGLSGKPTVSVAVPVMRQGQVTYLLSVAFNTEGLNNLLYQLRAHHPQVR